MDPTVATQALFQSGPSTGVYVTGAFTGNSVSNVYHDPALHRNIIYSNQMTPYQSSLVCENGATTVNSTCACPGAPSAPPFQVQTPMYTANYMGTLFSPIHGSYFPQVSPAVESLLRMRGRGPATAYSTMY